jgi:tetratricopeptide (TPR) repeat protein
MQKNLFLAGGAILIVAIIAGTVYLGAHRPTPVAPTTSAPAPATTTKSGYTIEQIPLTTAHDIAAAMPDPARPITFGASIPAQVRATLTARAATLAASLSKDPTDVGNWLDLAIAYHTANDFEGAKVIWEGLVKLIPKDTVALGNLGRLYEFDLHDFAKAESYFKQALALSKNETTYYIELHELYKNGYKTGTGADIAIAKQGLAAFPNSIDFLIMLGDDYVRMGDGAGARSYYLRASDLARARGDLELVQTIGQKLQSL